MEAAQSAQLPADEASLDEVHPYAWQYKITPGAFYDEVKADSRARGRMEAVLTEINERQATLASAYGTRADTGNDCGALGDGPVGGVQAGAPQQHAAVDTPLVHPSNRRRTPAHRDIPRRRARLSSSSARGLPPPA